MMDRILGFARDERGEGLIEYGFLAAFVASVAFATLILDPLHIRDSVVAALKKAVLAIVIMCQGDVEQR
jgi:Flp pilus assembly pilin Flp